MHKQAFRSLMTAYGPWHGLHMFMNPFTARLMEEWIRTQADAVNKDTAAE